MTRKIIFPIEFDLNAPARLYDLRIQAVDEYGLGSLKATGWCFKVWDCQVPLTGTIYDSSAFVVAVCTTDIGYNLPALANMKFTAMTYQGSGGAADKAMTVPAPSDYASPENLVWGKSYVASPTLDGAIVDMRITNNDGVKNCPGLGAIILNEGLVSAYSNGPSLDIDFATYRDQDPWFQISAGGIRAGGTVWDAVPITCPNDPAGVCKPAMTIESLGVGFSNNDIVSGQSVTNSSGCADDTCFLGTPNNWKANSVGVDAKFNYSYLTQVAT